ncbi:MAG: amidohydrolase [candidate division WOR-3 bacterium]|nr:amidohydrolase [candidate division WOR-3 bacterium]
MKATGYTIVDASARPKPATLVFDDRIRDIGMGSWGQSPFGDSPLAVIVPGLIDSHTHPLETGLQALFANLSGVTSVAEVQERLRARRADALEHGMMLGFNLEPDRLSERRYPTRHELDSVLPEVPVFVYRVDGHSAVTNTAGLQLILAKYPGVKPPGMEGDCNGRPTGVLRGETYEKASRVFKHRLGPDQVREALRLAGTEAATHGVTTIGALVGVEDTTGDEWRVLLDGLESMAVRAVPFLQTWNTEVPLRFGLKQAGGCLLIDGSFGSHTAAVAQDYADAPSNSGASYVTDDKLLSFLGTAADAGLQTTVHAIGDRAVEQVVRCHEQLSEGKGSRVQGSKDSGAEPEPQRCPTGAVAANPGTLEPLPMCNPLRHRIEHAELLNDSLVARIARLGLVLGVQPAFEAEWGGPDRMYAQRLGERWRNTNPYKRLLGAGVALAGGSDSPITPIDPVAGIRAAMRRPNPLETVSGEQALAMFTSAAAYSLNRERTCGSIEVGKDADFTVLTADPRSDDDCRVVATFRSGKCIFRDDKLAGYLQLEE